LNAADSDESLGRFLAHADVTTVVCHDSYRDRLEALCQVAPNLNFVIGLTNPIEDNGASFQRWKSDYGGRQVVANKGLDDIAIIKTSGGTTGFPKAILQNHRALETCYRVLGHFCQPNCDPVHLIAAPITHAAGATALALAQFGTTNVIASSAAPEHLLRHLEEDEVTHVFLPPTLIYRLLAHPDSHKRDFSKLEYIVYGAAPMSEVKLKEAIEVFGEVLVQIYGQAEVPGVITCLARGDHRYHPGENGSSHLRSAGRPTGACEVAIMDDEGKLLTMSETGEVVVRGDLVTPGYYKNEEANAEAHTYGWHHTGDIGRFDSRGFLHIVDRKKDLIISGGFNIYPSEVEQVIWSHAAVQDCAVIGIPDPDWGECVTAVVELKHGETTTAEEIVALCKERLGSIKSPKQVDFRDQLPRSAVGKVLKKELRASYPGTAP
jgi:acyl-CoA synthetase (AMP-forming)/AMP-acid ligase II